MDVAPVTFLVECDKADSRWELPRSQRLDDLCWIATTSPAHCLGPGLHRSIAVQGNQIGNHVRLLD
jgi:hypothetical protein